MKRACLLVCFFLLSAGCADCFPLMLGRGTREAGVAGYWDPKGAAGSEFDVNGSYGFFVIDNLLAGGFAGYSAYEDAVSGASADSRMWSLGAFLDYHFDIGMLTVPYAGIELGFANYRFSGHSSENAFFYGPRIGMKYFLSESAALDLAFKYHIASDDIYLNKGDFEDQNISVHFGVRVLF